MTPTSKKQNKAIPKYLHIYEHLFQQINNGSLKPGDRLPSFSELRTLYGAMPGTVDRTYARLERENLVVRQPRRGVFVASREQSLTGNIGLVLHSTYLASSCDSPYMQALLEGIREGCHEHDMKIVLMGNDDTIEPHQIDGLLLYCDKLEFYAMGIPAKTPKVMLFQHINDVTTITADDFGGSKLATSHLIKHGHKRIACLMEELQDIPIQRRAGYQAALQEAGITIQSNWLRLTKNRQTATTSYLQWGRQNMHAWLDEGWTELGCTAIVVQNDHAAIGVMQTLQEAGIDVPDQISVIGFDGTNICDLVRPQLTSIDVPIHQIGKEAVKVLLEQIKTNPDSPREISLPVKLRDGQSVSQI